MRNYSFIGVILLALFYSSCSETIAIVDGPEDQYAVVSSRVVLFKPDGSLIEDCSGVEVTLDGTTVVANEYGLYTVDNVSIMKYLTLDFKYNDELLYSTDKVYEYEDSLSDYGFDLFCSPKGKANLIFMEDSTWEGGINLYGTVEIQANDLVPHYRGESYSVNALAFVGVDPKSVPHQNLGDVYKLSFYVDTLGNCMSTINITCDKHRDVYIEYQDFVGKEVKIALVADFKSDYYSSRNTNLEYKVHNPETDEYAFMNLGPITTLTIQ